ncbi:MAG: thioredoxin [Oscillospiraceae bacterium]|nr:thioredoxin [Oscillospiraceae bacterium]
MAVLEIKQENFKTDVLGSEKPVLLDFWAAWCPPCRMQSPIVDEIAAERADIVVGKVNTDDQPELSAMFEVENIPTLVIIKDGKPTSRLVGLHSKEQILAEM